MALSEEKHRALVNNINDAIVLISENGEIIYQTPSVNRITGYQFDERENKSIEALIYHEDIPLINEYFKKGILSPGEPIFMQFRINKKNSEIIWVEGTGVNLLNNESVKAIVVNYRDITERKKYEEQQLLLTSIVNSSDDAIISENLEGIITSWNHGAEKILGFSKEEMIGQNILKVIPKKLIEEKIAMLENIKEGKPIEHFESQRLRKNGVTIDVSLSISPIKDSNGTVVGASKILRDITEWKKTQNLLQLQNKKLNEIANLQSHIVRQPLTSILGLIGLIDTDCPNNPSNFEVIPMLEIASKELDEIIHQIVENINDINAIES